MKRKMPLVKQVMTPFPFTIEATAPLSEARSMMNEHNIRHLPVTERHAIYGIISSQDIAVTQAIAAHMLDTAEITVSALCTKNPYTIDSHESVAKVALDMAERHIGAAIVTHAGKLAGIFTTTDACRVLGEHLSELYGGGSGDPEAA